MKVIFKVIDHLLAKPDALNLVILDKVLRVGIPFNAPHGFKIKKIAINRDLPCTYDDPSES